MAKLSVHEPSSLLLRPSGQAGNWPHLCPRESYFFPRALAGCPESLISSLTHENHLPVVRSAGLSEGVLLSPRRHLAMSGDIFHCHNWEGCSWHLMGPGVLLNILKCSQPSQQKLIPANGRSAQGVKPLFRVSNKK